MYTVWIDIIADGCGYISIVVEVKDELEDRVRTQLQIRHKHTHGMEVMNHIQAGGQYNHAICAGIKTICLPFPSNLLPSVVSRGRL